MKKRGLNSVQEPKVETRRVLWYSKVVESPEIEPNAIYKEISYIDAQNMHLFSRKSKSPNYHHASYSHHQNVKEVSNLRKEDSILEDEVDEDEEDEICFLPSEKKPAKVITTNNNQLTTN